MSEGIWHVGQRTIVEKWDLCRYSFLTVKDYLWFCMWTDVKGQAWEAVRKKIDWCEPWNLDECSILFSYPDLLRPLMRSPTESAMLTSLSSTVNKESVNHPDSAIFPLFVPSSIKYNLLIGSLKTKLKWCHVDPDEAGCCAINTRLKSEIMRGGSIKMAEAACRTPVFSAEYQNHTPAANASPYEY